MGKAIVVTSGKGGVGKTTTSANVGTALALLDKKVCLIDTDIGLRNLDVVMGLENRIVFDIVDVTEGSCRLEQALIRDKRVDQLFVLPAAQTKDKSAIRPDQMEKIVTELKRDFDYIVIDCPAGIEQGFQNAVSGADEAIVVTTPENSAVRDADRIIGLLLERKNINSPKLVINRIRPMMVNRGEMLAVDEIVSILAVDLLGIIPDDESVIKASNEGEPVVMNHDSKAALAYRNIGRRILGDHVPLMRLDHEGGMVKKIKKLFGLG